MGSWIQYLNPLFPGAAAVLCNDDDDDDDDDVEVDPLMPNGRYHTSVASENERSFPLSERQANVAIWTSINPNPDSTQDRWPLNEEADTRKW